MNANARAPTLLKRFAAFSDDPRGGNPAGVWFGPTLPPDETMQCIAMEIGYSETAFLAPRGERAFTARYFSPAGEVPFCGHATLAAGVLLGQIHGAGDYLLATAAGEVAVRTEDRGNGIRASLTTVATAQRAVADSLLHEVLAALDWRLDELDDALPPALAFAGAWHLVLAVATKNRLDRLDYDFERLRAVMHRNDLTTLQLVWRESARRFHARNPFPVGGVVEDPATGAAAAALAGYLRDAGLMEAPFELSILQGEAMSRPGHIEVRAPLQGGITISGNAVSIEDPT